MKSVHLKSQTKEIAEKKINGFAVQAIWGTSRNYNITFQTTNMLGQFPVEEYTIAKLSDGLQGPVPLPLLHQTYLQTTHVGAHLETTTSHKSESPLQTSKEGLKPVKAQQNPEGKKTEKEKEKGTQRPRRTLAILKYVAIVNRQ